MDKKLEGRQFRRKMHMRFMRKRKSEENETENVERELKTNSNDTESTPIEQVIENLDINLDSNISVRNSERGTETHLLNIHNIDRFSSDDNDSFCFKNKTNKRFEKLEFQLSDISMKLDYLKSIIEKKNESCEDILTFQKLYEKYKLECPIKSKSSFLEFEKKFDDAAFKDDFRLYIKSACCIDKTATSNLTEIYKKFIYPTVLSEYVAQKGAGKKPVMAETKFFKEVEDVMIAKYALTTDKEIKKITLIKSALSTVMNNSTDWPGGSRYESGGHRRPLKKLKVDENSSGNENK